MCVLMIGFLIKALRNEEFGFYLKAWCKFLKLDLQLYIYCVNEEYRSLHLKAQCTFVAAAKQA